MKRLIFIILTLSIVGSCRIYSSYSRPEIEVSDSLFRMPVSEDTSTVASLSWKELFTDPYLQELIDSGLVRNTDLQIARLKIQEAEAVLLLSRMSFVPTLSLNPEASIRSFENAVSKSYSVPVSASWEIDIFGKLRNANEQAKASLLGSRAYCQAVQTQLIATIADSYYTLLMLDEQLELSEQTSDNWESYVKSLNALMENGSVTMSEIAQARASKIQVDASVLSIRQQIRSVENALSVVLGREPSAIERGSLNEAEFPESLSVGIPLQLLRNRPDIMEAEYALQRAFYVTNAAYSAFYPTITLSGLLGWTNSGGGSIVNPGNWLMNAVGSLVQPILNKGNNISQLKISKAQQEEAKLTFQQSILDAGAEVNDALIQWQTAREKIKLDRMQIDELALALKSTELSMEFDDVNYLEVLLARQSLLQAQLAEVEDRYGEISGVISLYHALGGGRY